MGTRIDVRTYPVDRAPKCLTRKRCHFGLEILAFVDTGYVAFENVAGNPDILKRTQRKQHVSRVNLLPAYNLLLHYRSCYRRPHEHGRARHPDGADVARLEP